MILSTYIRNYPWLDTELKTIAYSVSNKLDHNCRTFTSIENKFIQLVYDQIKKAPLYMESINM